MKSNPLVFTRFKEMNLVNMSLTGYVIKTEEIQSFDPVLDNEKI